jgi:hypothetical protein
MPHLNWSLDACAALRERDARRATVALFDAYFRAARELDLRNQRLPLDLPTGSYSRYHLYAEYTAKGGWIVNAELKHEHRILK